MNHDKIVNAAGGISRTDTSNRASGWRSRLAWPRWLVLLATAHAALIHLSYRMSVTTDFPSVRPAVGLFVGALLVTPRRRWPAVIAVAFGVGSVVYLLEGRPPVLVLALVVGGVLEVVVGAYLCQRLSRTRCDMTTPESVASLWLTCALVAPVIGASIGWGALWLTSPTPPSVYVLGVWYAADALGIMLLAPLVIGYGRWPEPFPVLRVTTPARVEKLLIMVACICLAFWVFGQPPSSSGTPGKWLVAVAVVLGSWRLSTGEVGVMALGVGCALLGNVPHASLALGSGTVQHRVATSQVILGVLFLAAHVMSVSSSNLRRAELRSRMEKDRIRELSARVAEAEHLERRMISAALHDKVAQPLVAARIKLGLGQAAGDHDERNAILNEVSSILSVALSNSAELLDSVSPSVLYELGIGSALEWLARHYTRPGGALVSAETRNVSKNLPESVAIALYRCARELVSNAVDHSRASSIFVRCRQEPRFLVLEVEDDGEGLPVPSRPAGDAPRTGLGLLAVREQAARVNGVVEVLTRPGNGTLVRLRLPTFMPERAGDERIVRFDASLDGGD